MFIPPPIRLVKKCERCGLQYPRKEVQCTHCNGLTDREVEELKLKYEEEHKGNANLGKLFLYMAILIAIGMVILINT